MKLARFPALQWVGRAGITQLALAAVDVALWDLRAKHAGMPLWAHSAAPPRRGSRPTTPTSAGCRSPPTSWSTGSRQAIEVDGYRRLKLKVGSRRHRHRPRPHRGGARGRRADDITIAVDGNGKWDLPTCLRFCADAEPLDLFWFEEPLWYDDVAGHARAGPGDDDPGRARRAALYGRRLQRLHGCRRRALRPARRDPARRHQRVHHRRRGGAWRGGCRWCRMSATWGRSMSTSPSGTRRRRCSNTSRGSWTASRSRSRWRTAPICGRSSRAPARRRPRTRCGGMRRRWGDADAPGADVNGSRQLRLQQPGKDDVAPDHHR